MSFDIPECDLCGQEISGRVIRDGLGRYCKPCWSGVAITPKPLPPPPAPYVSPILSAPKPEPKPEPPPVVPPVPVPEPAPAPVPAPKPKPKPKRKPKRKPRPHAVMPDTDVRRTGCIVIGCDRKVECRQLCHAHYLTARRLGLKRIVRPAWVPKLENIDPTKQTCIAIGCCKGRVARGFCCAHWTIIKRRKAHDLLLPPMPREQRNADVRHHQPMRKPIPDEVIIEAIRLRQLGHTWRNAAQLAGAADPFITGDRIKHMYNYNRLRHLGIEKKSKESP